MDTKTLSRMPRKLAVALGLMALSAAPAQSAVEAWVQRYTHHPGNSSVARAIVVHGAGNVFVTGYSIGSGTSWDYATVAYSGAGMPLWTNRYNGPGNSSDEGTDIAVDGSGNVFVTGYSIGSGTSWDYTTVAYSGSGVPLWTNRYDGLGDDYAVAIAVDGSGNVFVTGWSVDGPWPYYYATVAYSGTGVPLWTNRSRMGSYSIATAIAVDGSGNVFVTGESSGDYATVAYSGAGVPLWTNRYNGPGIDHDRAHRATAIAVDGSGNVFVTGQSSGDYATVAYSGAGVPLWTNRYNGPGNYEDRANAIAVDGSGNIFVTGEAGYRDAGNSYSDYATLAYSGAGVPLWTNRYHGPFNFEDRATAIAVDGSGNVFVTGDSWSGGGGSYDYATVAYSGAGVPLWTNRYNGPGNSSDQATAIAVDGSGNIFVTGRSAGPGGRYDYATIKYWRVPYVAIEADGRGGYFIRFNGIPGSTYRLERATNVNGPWTSSSPRTAPASGMVEFWDFFPPPNQAFYRVRVE